MGLGPAGQDPPPWRVLLIAGPSGCGKSELSRALARRLAIPVTEVDDFQAMLLRMTTPEQQPAIHFWNTHPEPDSADEIVERLVDQSVALCHGLEGVIANHLEADSPVILEGDFILPELAARQTFLGQPNRGRVRGLLLHEPDEQQLLANYLRREPAAGPQPKRAAVSGRHGLWLKAEAERHGLPVIPARPWNTLAGRALAALR